MAAALRVVESRKYPEDSEKSKQENSVEGQKWEKRGRAESKAAMKGEQNTLARANKFSAVN